MWKTVLAGTAAAVISSSSLVFAHQMCDRDGASRWQPSAADIKAFTDARVAALKAALQLTAEQEKNWPAVGCDPRYGQGPCRPHGCARQ